MDYYNSFEIVYRDEQTPNKASFLWWLLKAPAVRNDRFLKHAVMDYLRKVLDITRHIRNITGTMFSLAVLLFNRIMHPIKGAAQNLEILQKSLEKSDKDLDENARDLSRRDEYIFKLLGIHDKKLYLNPEVRSKYAQLRTWILKTPGFTAEQRRMLLNTLTMSRGGHFIVGGLERELLTKEEFEKYAAFAKEKGEEIWNKQAGDMVIVKVNDLFETFARGEVITKKQEAEEAIAKKYTDLASEFRLNAIDTAKKMQELKDAARELADDPGKTEEKKMLEADYVRLKAMVESRMEEYRQVMGDYEKTIAGKTKLLDDAKKQKDADPKGLQALKDEIRICKKDYELLSLKVAVCLQLLNTDSLPAFISEQNACIAREKVRIGEEIGEKSQKTEVSADSVIDESLKKYHLTCGSETEVSGPAQQKEIVELVKNMVLENREELSMLKIRLIAKSEMQDKDGCLIGKKDDYYIVRIPTFEQEEKLSETGKKLHNRLVAIPKEGIVEEDSIVGITMNIPLSASFHFVDKNMQITKEKITAPDLFIHGNFMPTAISMSSDKSHYIDGEKAQIVERDGIRYGITDERAIVLKGMMEAENVIIPEQIEGLDGRLYPVDEIKEGAFRGCLSLTTLKIPSTMTEIAPHAFENCTRLETIEYTRKNPEQIIDVSEDAFNGCCSLISVAPELAEFIDLSETGIENVKPKPGLDPAVQTDPGYKSEKKPMITIDTDPDIEH